MCRMPCTWLRVTDGDTASSAYPWLLKELILMLEMLPHARVSGVIHGCNEFRIDTVTMLHDGQFGWTEE